MSDTDDHSSLTDVYASGDGSGLASQNDLSPSEVRRRVVQSSKLSDEHQLEQVNWSRRVYVYYTYSVNTQGGMITIASFSQDYQAPTVLVRYFLSFLKYSFELIYRQYDFGGNSATAFGPEQQSVDTVLKSSDAVFFYVHRHVLDGSSENGFGAGNVGRSLIAVDDDAVTLNIILHAVYDRPSDKFSPTVLQLIRAVDRMPIYGMSVPQLVQQTSNLFTLLSSMINPNPLDIYALAAYHSLDALAILASSHLVLFDLSSLPEEMIDRIGGHYLRRLSELQMSRNQELLDILAKAPLFAHDECPADPCGAWAFAGYSVLKIMNPGKTFVQFDTQED